MIYKSDKFRFNSADGKLKVDGKHHDTTGHLRRFIEALIQFKYEGKVSSYDALAEAVGTHQGDKVAAMYRLASKARKLLGGIIESWDDGYRLTCEVWIDPQPESTVTVTRVTDWDDRDIYDGLKSLYDRRIPIEDQHQFGDFDRWILEYEEEEIDSDYPFAGYLLAARARHEVVGFVFAELHKPSGYLFINWLAVTPDRVGVGVTEQLFANLVEIIRQEQLTLRLVAYEFTDRIEARIRWNDGTANHLARKLMGLKARAYLLPVDYIQPLLDLQQIELRRQEREGLLVYVPINPPVPATSREAVQRILRIFVEWYRSTFDDDYSENVGRSEQYSEYLENVFHRIMDSYPSVK